MKINRRLFLGAAATSPFQAKELAHEAARKLAEASSMQAVGTSLYSDSLYTGIATPVAEAPMRSLWEAITDLGVPDWKQEDLREDARRNRTLDPDIAALRSVSLSVKMRMQWDRNYETLVNRAKRQTQLERMKRGWFQTNPNITEY